MAKNFRLAGRSKSQEFEWLKWGHKRPDLEDGLWLVDWRSLSSPKYCVYVIAPDGQWPVKIGISHSPRTRLGNLQVGNWKRLEVAHCFWTESQSDALAIEKEVHRDYSEQKKWLLGEWVDTRPNEARERIEWAALILGVNIGDGVPPEAVDYIKARIDALWPWNTYYQAMAEREELAHRGGQFGLTIDGVPQCVVCRFARSDLASLQGCKRSTILQPGLTAGLFQALRHPGLNAYQNTPRPTASSKVDRSIP